jgi:hypothetical protein
MLVNLYETETPYPLFKRAARQVERHSLRICRTISVGLYWTLQALIHSDVWAIVLSSADLQALEPLRGKFERHSASDCRTISAGLYWAVAARRDTVYGDV